MKSDFSLVNKKDINQSWIIVQKEVILCDVDGVLLAPKQLTQNRKIASSTGVVTESMLEEHFPQYDAQMLTQFLIRMEFCRKVESSILDVIKNNFTDASNRQVQSKFLFFAALVDVDRPHEVDGAFEFGLCLQCSHSWPFSTRFFQVLQLHLSYKHALPKETQTSSSECSMPPGIDRKCIVWKNGILWTNNNGIKTVVEVTNHFKTLLLVMAREPNTEVVSAFSKL